MFLSDIGQFSESAYSPATACSCDLPFCHLFHFGFGLRLLCVLRELSDSFALGQVDTNNFLVIACEHAALGEGRVAPDDGAAEGGVCRFEDMKAADLFVAIR